jgi:serine/threonine-protein kinase HipA
MNCPGCLKAEHESYCPACRTLIFDESDIAPVLTFSRPAYDQKKLTVTSDRLSISGIQTKISLVLREGKLEMTESGGQFIFKPIPRGEFLRLEAVPINENLTMQIARQVFDIEVAANGLIRFQNGEPAYIVRRFDVAANGAKSLQEDMAQIAGRSEETHGRNYKYDFSYEEIAELIRKHVAQPQEDVERFFKLVVFNYLVNNGDAHIKNFSLIMESQTSQYRLTPAYDLLDTRLHLPNETRTALELFKDEFETASFKANAFYAHDDFREFARRLLLEDARAERILNGFVEKKDEIYALVDRSQLSDECKQLYKEHVQDSMKAIAYSYSGRLLRSGSDVE